MSANMHAKPAPSLASLPPTRFPIFGVPNKYLCVDGLHVEKYSGFGCSRTEHLHPINMLRYMKHADQFHRHGFLLCGSFDVNVKNGRKKMMCWWWWWSRWVHKITIRFIKIPRVADLASRFTISHAKAYILAVRDVNQQQILHRMRFSLLFIF